MRKAKKKSAKTPARKSKPKAKARKQKARPSPHSKPKVRSSHSIDSSRISTAELEKMKAFGILPFELRRELYKRQRK